MEDLTGMRLGQYQVLAPLGEGGMAAVYKAYQASVDRQVALKVLPRHFASDPEFTGRFEQEAKLIAKLQHVHILPVYDFGEAEGYTYIVMPFIETGTLADLMHGEAMPLDQVRGIITQIGEALAYAHDRGLVHRDVKPSNILIDHAGNCLLTDFGIAKIVEGTTKFTQTGAIIGTPAYMSPEQIRGDKLDGRSDQYSLGIVLYEMATGRPPFRAETPPAIFVKHLHDPLPPPSTINPDLPEDLERVILKCLAKDPAARYPDLGAMLKALERAIPRRRDEPAEPKPAAAMMATTVAVRTAAGPAAGPGAAGAVAPDAEARVAPPTRARPGLKIPGWLLALGGLVVVGGLAGLGALALQAGRSSAQPTARPPTARPPARPSATSAPQPTLPARQVEPTLPPPTEPAPALVSGCVDPLGCVSLAPGEPIHIVWALTVSGETAPLGQDSLGGIQIAIEDHGGELLGHPIELTGEDTLCTREGGQAAGAKIASDPTVVGIIGTSCSREARGAMPYITEAGMVMISPSSTNPELTEPNHPDYRVGFLRTAQNDVFQGRLAAQFVHSRLGLRRAATIHDGTPYSQSLQEVFASVFRELGGTISSQLAVGVGDTEMMMALVATAISGPQAIYLPVFEPEGDLIVQQARQLANLQGTILMGADGLFADTFPEATGEAAAGMYLSAPYLDPANASYAAFLDKWQIKFGGQPPSGYHAHAYDATNILFAAIERVAGVDAQGTLYIGRQALRDAMYATSAFPGLTGTLTCSANGDCATGEALAVFAITEAEVAGSWPPEVFWRPGQ